MATKLDSCYDASRKDFYMLDPSELIVRPDLGGRRFARSPQDVQSLAHSMMMFGQQQPVNVRKVDGNRLQLVFGFTRVEAVKLIREGFDYTDPTTGETTRQHNADFKLKAVITDGNEKSSFLANVVENAHRNQTSPIDDAFNQHRLRDQYGMSNTDIAKLYRWDLGKVGKYQRLLSLSDDVQALVHVGHLAVCAALDLLDLPEDQRAEAVKQATTDKGKVNGSEIRAIVREQALQVPVESPPGTPDQPNPNAVPPEVNGEAPKPTKKKSKALSIVEVRKFWEQLASDEKFIHSERMMDLCKVTLSWFKGGRSAKTMRETIQRAVEGA